MIRLINDSELEISLLLVKIRLAMSDGQDVDEFRASLVEFNAAIVPIISHATEAEGDATLLNIWQMLYGALSENSAEGYFEEICSLAFAGLWSPPSKEILAFADVVWISGDAKEAEKIAQLKTMADEFERETLAYAAKRLLLTNLSMGTAWLAAKDITRALVDDLQNASQDIKTATEGLPLWAVFPRPFSTEGANE